MPESNHREIRIGLEGDQWFVVENTQWFIINLVVLFVLVLLCSGIGLALVRVTKRRFKERKRFLKEQNKAFADKKKKKNKKKHTR